MDRHFRMLLHGQPVGNLVVESGGACRWWWERAWMEASEQPVVSLALLNQRLAGTRRAAQLPPFLTNLLPERESALRRRIARTHGIAESDDASLLTLLGGDMSGALQVLPGDEIAEPTRLRLMPAAAPLAGYRVSLGGMQLKFSANIHDRVTLPARGEVSHWILKIPPADKPQLPALEASNLAWARAVGFDVPEARIIPTRMIDGLPADILDGVANCLAVRRFDRGFDGTRVHMEEICSALGFHPEEKYPRDPKIGTDQRPTTHTLMAVGRVIRRFAKEQGARTFVQRVVFDALAGNGDAHLKNWALLFPDGRRAEIAPAYDVVPTVLLQGDRTLALPLFGHELLGNNRFTSVTPSAIREMAKKLQLDADLVEGEARALVERAERLFDEAVAPYGLTDHLVRWGEHMRSVARAWRLA